MSAAYAIANDTTSKASVKKLIANIQAVNIAEQLDDVRLARLGSTVCEEYETDLATRKAAGWDERNEAAMKLALQTKEVKNFPWPGASNIKFPLVVTAAIQFNARAYPAIVDGANVVKGKVLGEPSDEKQERADRIARHMSWQLLEEMDGWEEDTDRLLVMLPVTGTVFRKTWYDPVCGYNCSKLITPDKLVVNYWAKDLDSCPRVTQEITYYPHEIEERRRARLWLDVELGEPQDAANDELAPHTFLEQHRLFDLDEDGYPEPYIVTVHKETMKVVRIVARYDEDGVKINARGEVQSIEGVRYFTKYSFIPSADGAFYDIGFGHLLLALNETINSIINQLNDAGTLANLQSGFIGSGVNIKGGTTALRPGEWRKAEVTGGVLKDNIVALPVAGPSPVLFELLGMLIEAAKDITATKDILTGETQGQNQPVGTTLATIEQGLKVFTAIYKRVHRALKQELACLYRLNRLYLDPKQYFNFQDTPGAIAQKDYASGDVDVMPVSDPSVVTDMQRIARAQFAMQFMPLPFMDGPEIAKRALEAAGVTETKALFAKQQAPDPAMMKIMGERDDAKNKHDLESRRLDLEERQMAIDEATAKANNTATYAAAVAALAGAGQVDSVTTDKPVSGPSKPAGKGKAAAPAPKGGTKTVSTVNQGIPQHATDTLAGVHSIAVAEINAALAEQEAGQADDAGQPEVQSGDVQPVEGSPPDGAVPDVPEGQAGPAGEPMGAGQPDGLGDAGQGIPPGAVGPDQMG